MWKLSFISEEDFVKHVELTIRQYGDKLVSRGTADFNKNIIDPIKLIFDKTVYGMSWEEVVKNELFRQRDKSVNNDIGYFHQRIFQYISKCTVPSAGWDVVYKDKDGIQLPDGSKVSTVYVELKNKHNTMNSSSADATFLKMQNQLLKDDSSACFLVEVIAKRSQNIVWRRTVDGVTMNHRLIRKVSIDEFYKLVTKQEDAFYQMCLALPKAIEYVIGAEDKVKAPRDTVIEELRDVAAAKGGSMALALYMLGFESYLGFSN